MLMAHGKVPFEFVLMMGDNLYGSQKARDFADKFGAEFMVAQGIEFVSHRKPTSALG